MSSVETSIQLKRPFDILRNGSLSTLNTNLLLQHGHTVAGLLKQLGGDHTFHPPAEELQFAMATNHALLAQDPNTNTVAGFVKAVPWIIQPDQKPKMLSTLLDIEMVQQNHAKPVCVEVGSLVVALEHQGQHLGRHLAHHSVTHAKETYGNIPVIAVVTNDNGASLKVFHSLGWKVINREHAVGLLDIDVLDGWEPPSTIFLYPN